MESFDVIVIGAGGMGSAVCHALSRRSLSVLALEQFPLVHALGTSHGHTRLIRKAYFESPLYIPLLERSYELWTELERLSGEPLFERVGLLMMGKEGESPAIGGAMKNAAVFNVPLERWTRLKIQSMFPQFTISENTIGIWEPLAGYVQVERSIRALLTLARANGARLFENCKVVSWSNDRRGAQVVTDRETFHAKYLVITAGPWSKNLLSDLDLPLKVHRVIQAWFPSTEERLPCFAFDEPPHFLYGFPSIPGIGLKAALHAPGHILARPEDIDREISDDDTHLLAERLNERVAGVGKRPSNASACYYTMTPDSHFIIDKHRKHPNVFYAAGFSGHGFKFIPVVGEIIADLVTQGETKLDIHFLRDRWH